MYKAQMASLVPGSENWSFSLNLGTRLASAQVTSPALVLVFVTFPHLPQSDGESA